MFGGFNQPAASRVRCSFVWLKLDGMQYDQLISAVAWDSKNLIIKYIIKQKFCSMDNLVTLFIFDYQE